MLLSTSRPLLSILSFSPFPCLLLSLMSCPGRLVSQLCPSVCLSVTGRQCVNLRSLVLSGGVNVSNNGLKTLADSCTHLTVPPAACVSVCVCMSVSVCVCVSVCISDISLIVTPPSLCLSVSLSVCRSGHSTTSHRQAWLSNANSNTQSAVSQLVVSTVCTPRL